MDKQKAIALLRSSERAKQDSRDNRTRRNSRFVGCDREPFTQGARHVRILSGGGAFHRPVRGHCNLTGQNHDLPYFNTALGLSDIPRSARYRLARPIRPAQPGGHPICAAAFGTVVIWQYSGFWPHTHWRICFLLDHWCRTWLAVAATLDGGARRAFCASAR